MTFVVFSIFYSSVSQFVVCSNTLWMRESMWSRSCGCVYNCIQSTLCSAFSPMLLLHKNICYKIEAKYKYKYISDDLVNTFILWYVYVIFSKPCFINLFIIFIDIVVSKLEFFSVRGAIYLELFVKKVFHLLLLLFIRLAIVCVLCITSFFVLFLFGSSFS